MTSSQHLVYFMRELETERNTLRAFIEILKKEENALVEGRIEKIDHLASDKSRLIEELIKLDDHRNEYLQKQGLSLEKSSINAWLAEQHSGQSEVKILWDELLDLAKTAQQLNHLNGLIISTQLQHNQHAFSALHCAAGNVSLYGPQGQTYI
ncbi:MAG: flagellar protein FlgN [Nitrosomonas sp.]|uniref:flagella synthesis protein FlgN n=1 Tax=Nitrosomonas sp. TaxID=42353 RepID=UPI0027311E8F|nr:flagellar protein FlgN [Nitrosomonas sp.]MDP1551057.1 flagellar protein FlgN [Nitrosomonas sp.]MDP1933640.1 flagellar protein FlgN [Nitrosomonas sp.]